MDFTPYDSAGYETLDVREGYGEWAATYEDTVSDEMDLALLARLGAFADVERALDLACGTGRVGAWLRAAGAARVDGVDLVPEMLARAKAKDVYEQLLVADITRTPLKSANYDLVTQSLADEHLADLAPLYREARRLTKPGAPFVLVGYHPYFLMNGISAHFDRATGQPVAVQSYVHLISDQVRAGRAAGFHLDQMHERLIDDAWVAIKPKWERFRGRPVTFVMLWT